MDRRDFFKSILAVSAASPLLVGLKTAPISSTLYLLSDSPSDELAILLEELHRRNILRGKSFSFSTPHPQKKAIAAGLQARGWQLSSGGQAGLNISFSLLQAPAKPSFTLLQDGRICDVRTESLYALWREMQHRPLTRSLTIMTMSALSPSPQKGHRLSVRLNGRVIERLSLNQNVRRNITTESGHISFIIKDGQASVESSSCPHHLCLASPPVEYVGERIICAPNHFLLEIEGRSWLDAVIG